MEQNNTYAGFLSIYVEQKMVGIIVTSICFVAFFFCFVFNAVLYFTTRRLRELTCGSSTKKSGDLDQPRMMSTDVSCNSMSIKDGSFLDN